MTIIWKTHFILKNNWTMVMTWPRVYEADFVQVSDSWFEKTTGCLKLFSLSMKYCSTFRRRHLSRVHSSNGCSSSRCGRMVQCLRSNEWSCPRMTGSLRMWSRSKPHSSHKKRKFADMMEVVCRNMTRISFGSGPIASGAHPMTFARMCVGRRYLEMARRCEKVHMSLSVSVSMPCASSSS